MWGKEWGRRGLRGTIRSCVYPGAIVELLPARLPANEAARLAIYCVVALEKEHRSDTAVNSNSDLMDAYRRNVPAIIAAGLALALVIPDKLATVQAMLSRSTHSRRRGCG
jgi:hypothetical protein